MGKSHAAQWGVSYPTPSGIKRLRSNRSASNADGAVVLRAEARATRRRAGRAERRGNIEYNKIVNGTYIMLYSGANVAQAVLCIRRHAGGRACAFANRELSGRDVFAHISQKRGSGAPVWKYRDS